MLNFQGCLLSFFIYNLKNNVGVYINSWIYKYLKMLESKNSDDVFISLASINIHFEKLINLDVKYFS